MVHDVPELLAPNLFTDLPRKKKANAHDYLSRRNKNFDTLSEIVQRNKKKQSILMTSLWFIWSALILQ
jgi:hypothetical protein